MQGHLNAWFLLKGTVTKLPLLQSVCVCLPQALVATFVRPGCAHVTVMGLVGPVDHSRLLGLGAQGVARQLLESGGWLLPSAVAGGPGGQPRGQAWAEDMLVRPSLR